MTLHRCLAITAALLSLAVTACAQAPAKPAFRLAITVDDLTAHGQLPPGVTRQQVADQFIATFKAHKVPEAWGFINGVQLEREPDSAGVLAAWRSGGYPLGNHGYTHMNSAQNPVAAFKGDIDGNEPLLKQYMGDADWRWLRFPFLAAGTDSTNREILDYVAQRGYRVADTTISYNDWAYTDTHARCAAKGDTAAIDALRARYMSDVVISVKRSRAISEKLYGRDIPHVVLIHLGAFTGEMLPQVLEAFEAEGVDYITLAQAQSDPAYTLTGPKAGQGMMLERMAEARGVDIATPDVPNLSDTNAIAQMCR